MSEQPPPYRPLYPSALSSQPPAFPGSPYQVFNQNYTDSFYPGAPAQPSYQSGHDGSHGSHGGHGGPVGHGGSYPPKHTVFVMQPHQDQPDGRSSCLKLCSAALCCCCLYDLLTSHLS